VPAYKGDYKVDPETGTVWREVGYTNGYGYRVLQIKGKFHFVHRMVWESVHGPIPEGMVINHINGVKSDNRIENLEVCTHSENHIHARDVLGRDYGAGSRARGAGVPQAKLTEDAVRDIRSAKRGPGFATAMAAKYGVTTPTIHKVLRRDTWTHV
jgi:hypothetical protein